MRPFPLVSPAFCLLGITGYYCGVDLISATRLLICFRLWRLSVRVRLFGVGFAGVLFSWRILSRCFSQSIHRELSNRSSAMSPCKNRFRLLFLGTCSICIVRVRVGVDNIFRLASWVSFPVSAQSCAARVLRRATLGVAGIMKIPALWVLSVSDCVNRYLAVS